MSANSVVSMVTALSRQSQPEKITQDVVIGKDVLELLTGAMYVDPLTIYREYIQNAADAIDEARDRGLYSDSLAPRIDIQLDHTTRTVRIRDNGIGVPATDFIARLAAIGGSQKRGKRQRGFRGVGRLSGLGYAQEVVFRSRSPGDAKVLEILWNGRKLREVLRDPEFADDLVTTIKEVADLSHHSGTGWPKHFFEVELRRVTRVRNDLLMNPEEIRNYLSQVAPVPFAPDFRLGAEISEYLQSHGIDRGMHIYIAGEDEPIHRPFQNKIKITDKITDKLSSLELIEIPGIEGTVDAIGWILHHSYFGALPRATGIAGLRARSGNIQVGGASIFESLFSEPRFNSWSVGEIHILSDRIIPNGRRDDFEINAHYQNLISYATDITSRLSKLCRGKSILRNRLRQAQVIFQEAWDRIAVVNDRSTAPSVRKYFRESIAVAIEKLERLGKSEEKFTDQERALISERVDLLRKHYASAKSARGRGALSFLPPRKQRVLIGMLQIVLEACDSPQQAAVILKRIIERTRQANR